MIWESWSQFWQMGGYGLYVWASMGVTALCIAIEIWQSSSARKRLLLQLRVEHEGNA
jgi:heme exporter protein D